MTPSACRGPGESCRYRDMAPRRRRSAAVGHYVVMVDSSWNMYPAGGTGQHVTAAMAAARRRRRRPPSAPPPPFTATGYHRRRTRNRKLLRVAGDEGRDGARPKCLGARAHIMSQGAGAYQCAAHSGGKKMGISAAAGTVNQTCVFIGSDLDGPSRLTPT